MKSFLGFLFLLSPLIIVVIWAILTWRGIRYGRQYLKNAGDQRKRRVALVILLGTIWFGVSFWYSGGRKFYYDAIVLSLCAKDGGVKVYERVELPAVEYDQYAKLNWAFPEKSQATSSDKYYSETNRHYFRNGDPKVIRRQVRIIRHSDDKILGEKVSYSRGGGDFPGPWHPSSFICPKISPNKLGIAKSIFYKE